MARLNDSYPFRNHLVDVNDEGVLVGMKCEFCGHSFAKGTSITRFKWHLSGEKGHQVSICEKAPQQVQEAAFLAMCGSNKRQRTIVSSSDVNDNPISTCPQEENNEVHNSPRNVGSTQVAVQGTEQGGEEENVAGILMHIDTNITPEGPMVDKATDQVSQVDIGGMNWQAIHNIAAQLMDEEEVRDALPTSSTKLVGRAFEKHENEILSWLTNDQVSRIGIYGMGGVGKTTLLKHVYNQLRGRTGVYWVTVSRDFNIKRLQNLIAKSLDLDLSEEDDELRRAVKLSQKLEEKQKWVLILDDLWDSFDLNKVGIPVPVNGCKLILTTRSVEVCRRMDCKPIIKVEVLSEEEAWTLFMEKLAHDVRLSPEVEQIAKSVMRECAGLPLGIITVAGSMKGKGVDDLREWRNTLQKLKQSKGRGMEDEVFGVLGYSYDGLNNLALQQCLLYCALFPEDYEILREDLIGYLIDEGIIEGMNSRQDEFDEGHVMLNELENVCLLEGVTERFGDQRRCVKLHDLIRDMAHQILQKKSPVMAGEELPDVNKWKEDLVRVSFIRGRFEEIPSSYSPRCPSLSTLLLCHNSNLRSIEDSFFKELHGLKILDLSETAIEILPDSVSDLARLSVLLLSGCKNLRHVPSLEKLRALKRLVLTETQLENVPRGMECLSNLTDLRMNGCGQKEFPTAILPKLNRLQVLIIENYSVFDGKYAPVTVKGKEVACLRKLETLKCHFEHLSDFAEYFKSRDATQSLSTYQIIVGRLDEDDYSRMMKNCRNKSVGLGNFSVNRDGDFQVMFPNDVEELMICKSDDAIRSLCDVSSLIKCATELEVIDIWNCNSMESLVSSSWFCSASPPSPSLNGIFSGLKRFYCHRCKGMKKLFPDVLLPNLVNLEVIEVTDCEEMEEIIATRDEGRVMGEEFCFPNLRILRLGNLPELKSCYRARLICPSLKEIEIRGCWRLICRVYRWSATPLCYTELQKKNNNNNNNEVEEENNTGGDSGGKKGEKIPTPVVLVEMRCDGPDGCVSKIIMPVYAFEGVESVKPEAASNKLTVVGNIDPLEIRDYLIHETKKKPPMMMAVFKQRCHCDGCMSRIRKTVCITKGVYDVVMDKEKELVTVLGTMDVKALTKTVKQKLKKPVDIVPPKKEKEGGKDGDNAAGGGGGGNGGQDGKAAAAAAAKMELNRMEFMAQPGFGPGFGYVGQPIYGNGYMGQPVYASSYGPGLWVWMCN